MAEFLNPNSAKYIAAANAAADANGIPREIFQSLVQQESSWNPFAVGGNGQGLTQLDHPKSKEGVNVWDPVANLNAGAKWLKMGYDRAGNWADALSIYNSGRTVAESNALTNKWKGAGANYANEVLGRATALGYVPGEETGTWADDPLGRSWEIMKGVVPGLDAIAKMKEAWDKFTFKEFGVGFILAACGVLIIMFSAWKMLQFEPESPAHA